MGPKTGQDKGGVKKGMQQRELWHVILKFKITEMELRKKYLYVLDISGKRDEEITTIVMNRAEREEAATAAEVAEGFADSLRRPAVKFSRTPQSLRLEIATLEAQLLDQERYHVEQVSVLENE